ncbi:hypothetical protein [Actinomadura madurae]|uniref:hypothetical protein n=1 Tax=Actinomadura madurae TaxID=1993 RepID=UPI003D6A2CC7
MLARPKLVAAESETVGSAAAPNGSRAAFAVAASSRCFQGRYQFVPADAEVRGALVEGFD